MISNRNQLEIALSQLETFQAMLEVMRERLAMTGPELFPKMAEGYLSRIRTLETDIIEYLRERPSVAPLTVRIAGPEIHNGVIRANLAAQIMSGIQSAIYQVGGLYSGPAAGSDRVQEGTGLRAMLGLNLIATAPGSFVLSLDLAPRQLKLFREFDFASKTVEKLIGHVAELSRSADEFTGPRPALRGIRKISALTKRGVEVISLRFEEEGVVASADVTPIVNERVDFLLGAPTQGERTVIGQLIEINTADNSCVVEPTGAARVSCEYDEVLEDDLIAALRKQIEMAGQFITTGRTGEHYRITMIERFRLLGQDPNDS